MYDYKKFKASAIRNKYEIAFETDKKRISYAELLKKVDALYNALKNMDVQGAAIVITDDLFSLAVTALALSKRGVKRVICESAVPVRDLLTYCKRYSPSVVFLPDTSLARLENKLIDAGVKTVVTYGQIETLFPASFEFEDLIRRNDYELTGEYQPTAEAVFSQDTAVKLTGVSYNEGIVCDLPHPSKACSRVTSEILYSGGKCFLFKEITKKICKKKKVDRIITDSERVKLYEGFGCAVFDASNKHRRVGDAFFDADKISAKLSRVSSAKVTATYNGAVINTVAVFPADFNAERDKSEIDDIRDALYDYLSPFNAKKTFAAKKLHK